MDTGKVKKVMRDRGFGFIRMSDGREVFFHKSECKLLDSDPLAEGLEVAFDIGLSSKGPRAKNLRPRDRT